MKKIILFLSILVLMPTDLKASEKDIFLSLKNNKVHVRQGPGFNYPIKFIYTKKYIPELNRDASQLKLCEPSDRLISNKLSTRYPFIS